MITLAASDPSIGTLAFRLVGSLAVVVGLLLLIAKFANKKFAAPKGAPVQVMHRQALGRGQGVAVLSVGGRVLVVGTTEHQVTLLTELDPAEVVSLDQELAELPTLGNLDSDEPIDPIVAGALGLEVSDGFDAELAGATASYAATPQGALAGSVLSPQTWKQTFAALTGHGAPPPSDRRAS